MTFEQSMIFIVAPYSLLALGLGFGVYLFLTLKLEIARLTAQLDDQATVSQAAVDELGGRCVGLERDVDVLRESVGSQLPSSPAARAFRKAKILGMLKHGQEVMSIAQTLGVPDAHVDLVLKAHRINGNASRSRTGLEFREQQALAG